MNMNKNWKKGMVAIPLSFSLVVPMASGVAASGGEENMHGQGQPTVETATVELRSTLGHLLSEHGFLAVETMRNGAAGSADFEASAMALSANTEDLTAAITSV
ncbi:hypothetical protein [Planococcus lenghuensis]|uniref:hypothetical protein n=1 Tax=Planococcus lenghuensis TaxID=2213202 RepID=UPI00268A19CE